MARTTVVGACPHDCPDTCSILTTVEDGKAIAVRGNPDHPFTRGRLCVKVNNYEERVYSDKRLLYPLRRVGPKGSKQFQRISWDEAIECGHLFSFEPGHLQEVSPWSQGTRCNM
jgi:anaerobic selenocysteine-containing dehydrogenase